MGARFSAPVQTGPGAHPASCTVGTGSFPGVKSGRGVTLTPHPLLVPWSRKSRAIPLLPLWTVRPVQSLSACTRVHFTFFTLHIPPQTALYRGLAEFVHGKINSVRHRFLLETAGGQIEKLGTYMGKSGKVVIGK